MLLIDEIDKGDIDLPNDLLNIFEEGRYTVPELARLAERQPEAEVSTADPDAGPSSPRARSAAGPSRSSC